LEDQPRGGVPEFMDETIAAGERISPFQSDGAGATGSVRVFDERSGTFTVRAKGDAGQAADDEDFIRVTDRSLSPRASLYALESGKWRADMHKHNGKRLAGL
jgi:hypothetical protein